MRNEALATGFGIHEHAPERREKIGEILQSVDMAISDAKYHSPDPYHNGNPPRLSREELLEALESHVWPILHKYADDGADTPYARNLVRSIIKDETGVDVEMSYQEALKRRWSELRRLIEAGYAAEAAEKARSMANDHAARREEATAAPTASEGAGVGDLEEDDARDLGHTVDWVGYDMAMRAADFLGGEG